MYDNSKDVAQWFQDGGDTKRYNYKLTPDSVVVDLGGFQGDFARKIGTMFKCHVFVYEPILEFYHKCCHAVNQNHKAQVIMCGISGYFTGLASISLDGDASSVFKTETSARKETINLSSVKDWLDNEHNTILKTIDLLKINVEGAEYDILDAMIKGGYITRVKNIQVQFHNFVPNAEARRDALHKELLKTHRLTFNYPFVWENWELK